MDTASAIKLQLGSSVTIEMAKSPIQIGSSDCWVYAIATCVALVTEGAPQEYNRKKARPHLVECFEKLCLTPFP